MGGVFYKLFYFQSYFAGRLDTQHNDTQQNNTQHSGLTCDTQHNWPFEKMTLSITALYQNAECGSLFIVVLSVIMLNVVMLNVVMLKVVAPFV